MKITLCGSISAYDEMLKIKMQLEKLGHEVKLPPSEITNGEGRAISVAQYYEIRKSGREDAWIWDVKREAILNHFAKENWAEAILVVNTEKKDIPGYIGANTLIEMGVALFLNKKIYLLNPIPNIDCREEILGMKPVVINGDLGKII